MDKTIHPGDILRGGRYKVQEFVKSGQEKEIYLAYDRDLDCQVSLDIFASNSSVLPDGLTLNAWEARVLGHLGDHPNIATVLDRWNDGDTAFMTTRYLSGGSLKDLVVNSQKSGRCLPVDEILRISEEIASGLAHIHACHILYLDLQPKNILFDTWHKIHLVDFDTAVSLDDAGEIDLSHRPLSGYMASELLAGRPVDERADLYSLGVTLYYMCEGRSPFKGPPSQTPAVRRAVPATPLERDDLPESLRDLVLCLLAPEPEQRPASASEVVERLGRIRAGSPAPGHSQPFPQPDPAELRVSAGTRAADYAVGDVIDDRFEILEVLGEGGFSKVYRIRDEVEDEERAFKLFNNAAGYEAVRREISALRKINHPNVAQVFWAGRTNAGDWYLVTEFIEGERLDKFTSGGGKSLRDREAVDIALDLLAALVAFHPDSVRLKELDTKNCEGELSETEFEEWLELNGKGLVHRDMSPPTYSRSA